MPPTKKFICKFSRGEADPTRIGGRQRAGGRLFKGKGGREVSESEVDKKFNILYPKKKRGKTKLVIRY